MSYKEFITLGRHDSGLVVAAPLLAIRNAVDSAVTGVSAVSQAAASYAKQYSVVEKQEVDSDGHVTDTTNTARRSVALYELFDVKRRIQQVEANIDQYLNQVPGRVLPVRTVHPATITYAYYGGNGVKYRLRVNNEIDVDHVVSIQTNINEVSGSTALDIGFTAQVEQVSTSYVTDFAAEIGPSGVLPRHFNCEWDEGGQHKYKTATAYPVAVVHIARQAGSWETFILALQTTHDPSSGSPRRLRAVFGNTSSFYATAWFTDSALRTFDVVRLSMTSAGDVVVTPSTNVATHTGDPLGTSFSEFDLDTVLSGNFWARGFLTAGHSIHPTETVEATTWTDASTLTAEIKSMLPDFTTIVEDIDTMTVDA